MQQTFAMGRERLRQCRQFASGQPLAQFDGLIQVGGNRPGHSLVPPACGCGRALVAAMGERQRVAIVDRMPTLFVQLPVVPRNHRKASVAVDVVGMDNRAVEDVGHRQRLVVQPRTANHPGRRRGGLAGRGKTVGQIADHDHGGAAVRRIVERSRRHDDVGPSWQGMTNRVVGAPPHDHRTTLGDAGEAAEVVG